MRTPKSARKTVSAVLSQLPKPVVQRLNSVDFVNAYNDSQIEVIARLANVVVPVLLVTCNMPKQADALAALPVNRDTLKDVGARIREIHGRLHKASARHPEPHFQAALAGVGAVDHAATAAFEVDDHTREALDEAFKAVDLAEQAGALSTHDAGDLREDLNNVHADLYRVGVQL